MTPQELAELDLAVAKAEFPGETWFIDADQVCRSYRKKGTAPCEVDTPAYVPTRDPVEALRLLMKHRLSIHTFDGGQYLCRQFGRRLGDLSDHPCIAICRAVVALKAQA